ncbi:DNA methyltransferase [Fischerella major NIES-592]|uniref:Site-specific DNA-methyltransferase (adenine-specific) n=2 Tax=Fischerella TaxID=1190 RepID=A0A1U7H3Y9_9CYAN|nr:MULTISPECIES: DNA adenine methylase [Fischerella]OKH15862.1 DNA methyltransferase [Fischerella major NIES-592]PMB40134.1 DNA methyltransferase [Fischerella thermalis CCMEE 5330]BAU04188.1 DNA adenine methylase [Fischerella sp. NIES-3754]BCX06614.1 MAG: modification methylase [Fischerella sp.]
MVLVNKLVKPFLKWAGGKRQLVPLIVENYLPKNYNSQTYYEPFLGGGALLFTLQPKKAVINDINTELINCYQVVKDSVDELIDDLKCHKNNEDYYYAIRDWDREESFQNRTPVQRASRIIFLNKTCYNGLFRVNSQGQFNVPFGKYKNPNILDADVLKAVSKYLNHNQIQILNLDFQDALKDAKRGDFVYLDPPYDPVSDTASFTGYDVNGFNKDEQIRLKETFDNLDRKGCKVLLSNAYTNFIKDLYKDYKQIKISAIRAINSNAEKRGKVDEILVKNYE